MKKSCLLFCFLICSTYTFAQKVSVENNIENIGDGYNMAYRVSIPYARPDITEKNWKEFLKDNHTKVKSSKGSVTGKNMVINGMGTDSINVFSRVTETDTGALIVAAFQRKGTYISPATNSQDAELLNKLLRDLAKNICLEGIKVRSKNESQILKLKVKEQSELTKSNEHLISENEKMRKQISNNERSIKDNTSRLEDLKKEISKQESSIDDIKSKTKEIE